MRARTSLSDLGVDVFLRRLLVRLLGLYRLSGNIGRIGKDDAIGIDVRCKEILGDELGQRTRRRTGLDVQRLKAHLGIGAAASHAGAVDDNGACLIGLDRVLKLVVRLGAGKLRNAKGDRADATQGHAQNIRLLGRGGNDEGTAPTVAAVGRLYAFEFTHDLDSPFALNY